MDGEALARDRPAALALLQSWTESEALRRHAYAVEASVRAYARKRGADEDAWGCVALLHDFDYERHPTLDKHPQDGAPHLRELGYPGVVRARRALARQPPAGRRPARERARAACSSPATSWPASCTPAASCARTGLTTIEPRSVRKKLKQKSFAAGVNRDDVYEGAEGLGVDLDEHIQVVIDALKPISAELGLRV